MKYFFIIFSFVSLIGCVRGGSHAPINDLHEKTSAPGENPGSNSSGAPSVDGRTPSPSSSGGAVKGVYFKSDVLPMIKKNCATCHGPGSGRDWTDYTTFSSKKSQIQARVLGPAANMPPGGKLSEGDKKILEEWIQGGMKLEPSTVAQGEPPPPAPAPAEIPPAPVEVPSPGPAPVDPTPTPVEVPNIPQAQVPAVAQTCTGCHGERGVSLIPTFPRLAGQNKEYLVNQLKAFKTQQRKEGDAQMMWGFAGNLADSDIESLADYFSKQDPGTSSSSAEAPVLSRGQEIYLHGDAGKNVMACSACHGAEGQGLQTIPRLARQHGDYLYKQLNFFKSGERASDSMMPIFSNQLSDDDMKAVSAFLEAK